MCDHVCYDSHAMKLFAVAVCSAVVALGLVLGVGYALYRKDECWGRCGSGTRCAAGECVPAADAPASAPVKELRRRRGGPRAASEVQLKPGDERMASEGDAL